AALRNGSGRKSRTNSIRPRSRNSSSSLCLWEVLAPVGQRDRMALDQETSWSTSRFLFFLTAEQPDEIAAWCSLSLSLWPAGRCRPGGRQAQQGEWDVRGREHQGCVLLRRS